MNGWFVNSGHRNDRREADPDDVDCLFQRRHAKMKRFTKEERCWESRKWRQYVFGNGWLPVALEYKILGNQPRLFLGVKASRDMREMNSEIELDDGGMLG